MGKKELRPDEMISKKKIAVYMSFPLYPKNSFYATITQLVE